MAAAGASPSSSVGRARRLRRRYLLPCALVLRSAIQKKSYVAQCRFVVSTSRGRGLVGDASRARDLVGGGVVDVRTIRVVRLGGVVWLDVIMGGGYSGKSQLGTKRNRVAGSNIPDKSPDHYRMPFLCGQPLLRVHAQTYVIPCGVVISVETGHAWTCRGIRVERWSPLRPKWTRARITPENTCW